jgi:type IV pilus assembly protein PilB
MEAFGRWEAPASRGGYAMHRAEGELTGLAGYLAREGLLTVPAAQEALEAAARQGLTMTQYLVQAQLLSSTDILAYCIKQFGLAVFDLKDFAPEKLRDSVLKLELIQRYRVLPLDQDGHCLRLGITDPTDQATLAAVGFQTGLHIQPILVDEAALDQILNSHCRPSVLYTQLESALAKISTIEDNGTLEDEPITAVVDQLIQNAIEKNTSDIHIEPYENHCRIRFRRDGLLAETASIPSSLAMRMSTRLKIMANLNIAERRLPQDGRIQLSKEKKWDVRISTCPTLFGEKIVLRLLNTQPMQLDIATLGMTAAQQHLFLTKLQQPQGLILVTGPTGSGKTITLYSALQHLNKIEKNISSVEDPIEIELHGINQVPVNTKIGLDFATVLRTFLRQDPDVIMVGEIRDLETATIAMQAAQTGHLVLSTLHTNSAKEALTRLQSMGIASYHLQHTISLIIAQRLIRMLCTHCKQAEILPADPHRTRVTYRAMGCEQCYQGYQGRLGIFELIATHQDAASNMRLWDAGIEQVRSGMTSYAELMRVLGK